MTKTLEQLMHEVYFAGMSYYALAKESAGTISYSPVQGAVTVELVAQHIAGEICLGSYTLRPDDTVTWACWDVDSTDKDKARAIALDICEKLGDIPHGVEYSGQKGYHIWLFFEEAVSASKVREFGLALRELVGAPASGPIHVEFFPKQDKLTPSSPMGNLVKLPIGLHPKTHNRSLFVDVHNGWETGTPVDAATVFGRKVKFEDLTQVLADSDPAAQILQLLVPYWNDGERHDLCLALAGYLASLGWSSDAVETLVHELIAAKGGDSANLLQAVNDTFTKLSEGKSVQGFMGLTNRLPVNVIRRLSDLAGKIIADASVQLVDRVRGDKGPVHIKLRQVENIVMAHLRDAGRIIRGPNNVYWLNHGTHELIDTESISWMSMIKRKFGVNPKESFGAQLLEGIRLECWHEAAKATVHKRFHWDKQNLWLNFGGPEVYKMNGDRGQRVRVWNGENDMLFQTDGNKMNEHIDGHNLFECDPLDPWQFLTNDLSFAPSETTRATNEQQRQMLRAWILQPFFGSVLSTRPIALFIGPRGSGKTTAARRVLRMFEGFPEDVLGIAEDKPDSLRASLEQHIILALDNLEQTRAKWLIEFLNRLATGAQIELRKLHRTNEKYVIRPDLFVVLTGIEVPTNQESLYSRLLPFNMDMLRAPKPEYWMQSMFHDNFVSAWAGMLNYLDDVIVQLRTNTQVHAPTNSRLADFQVFCSRIKGASALDGTVLMEGLSSLVEQQQEIMGANSAAIAALDLWLAQCGKQRISLGDSDENDPTVWRSGGDLFTILHRVAARADMNDFTWTKANGFTSHFLLLVPSLERSHGLQTQVVKEKKYGRMQTQFRFPEPSLV